MTVSELLSTLRSLNAKVWVEGEQLRVSAPKGALVPELRQQISESKAEIIHFLQKSRIEEAAPNLSIPRVARTDALPLSSAQKRMWFLDQLHLGSSAYNIFLSQRFRSNVNLLWLEQCLTELVRRHETLRTIFQVVDGEPVQRILPPFPVSLPCIDLEPVPDADREHEAVRWVIQEKEQSFDLTTGPLFRTLLIRLGSDDYLFLMVMHHIISDGASIDVIKRELAALYTAYAADLPSPLPELPIQYADFAVWQRAMLQNELMEIQLRYWKEQLGGDLPVLELPVDHAGGEQTAQGGHKFLSLSPALTHDIVALAQREHVTVFMVMLATFQLLLHRLSGQEEVVLGTPIAGRNRSELEPLVGLFLNTLVLRTDMSGNPSFRSLLGRVEEVTRGAYANQDLPFERIVEELQPERSLNRNPLFDVLVNFTKSTEIRADESTLDWQDVNDQQVKLPITFYIGQYHHQIDLHMAFQLALFSPQRIECLLDQYEYLLQQVTLDSAQPIHSYSLVTPTTRSRLPDATQMLEEPIQEVVTTTVLRWAQEHPELPAIVHGTHSWSYGELGTQAAAVARLLVAEGCNSGDVVAVVGPRSFGLIAGMLGAWLSGGILLSLDLNLPPMRRQVMLDEAVAKWIISAGEIAPTERAVWQERGIRCFDIDDQRGVVDDPTAVPTGTEVALPPVAADQPAYIFFTSGTTNVPKGVLGVHKGLSHFLHWQRTTFAIGPGDRAAQLTGLSFDVVLRDIFTPLTSGATLYLPDEHLLGSGRILNWLQEKEITLLHTVPGIVQTWLIDAPTGVTLERLRWVFFAGEPLSNALVEIWRKSFGHTTGIINLYGPTETTLAKLFYRVPATVQPGVQPVGTPMPQTQALILRREEQQQARQLCGIGELGEIVIRTPFHSLGYINASSEQQKRFAPNPFRDDPTDLVYYTGDLGRYRLDGSIDILGRMDDQIKIRGVRIELGELNAALLAHPLVKSGVVVARRDERKEYLLAAYVVPAKEAQLGAADLRRYLAERFPAAMVPSAYVFLDALPLNANGKVDRRALPEVAATVENETRSAAQPQDLTEARLLKIWQKLLNTTQIGVEDDFFALGGHSLLVVRMLAQIYETFQVHLPLTSLFEQATIKHLAGLINAQDGPVPWSSLVKIQPGGHNAPFYCVHGMTGDVFWFRELVEYMNPVQPFWGLQARGLDGIQTPLTSIEEIATHYIEEIRIFQPEGPYYIGGYSFGASVAYEMARQLALQGQVVGLLAIIDHATPQSGYYKVEYTPRFFFHFFRNLPYRVRDFFRRRPDQLLSRVARQWRLTKKMIGGKLRPWNVGGERIQASDIIDQAPELSSHVQQLIECNFQAIWNYKPQSFSGRLTLLRARGGRLFCTHDPQMGWGKFVTGGIDVRIIPGSHLQLFKKPHVRYLAEELQRCLEEAQRSLKQIGEA